MDIYTGKAHLGFTSGRVIVDNPNVKKDSVIFLTGMTPSSDYPCKGIYSVADIIEGISFTILTNEVGDISLINWMIVNEE